MVQTKRKIQHDNNELQGPNDTSIWHFGSHFY